MCPNLSTMRGSNARKNVPGGGLDRAGTKRQDGAINRKGEETAMMIR